MIRTVLNHYAVFAGVILFLALALKYAQLIQLRISVNPPMSRKEFSGVAIRLPFFTSLRHAVYTPMQRFHMKTNCVWTVGYAVYHMALVLLLLGYAVSALIVLAKIGLRMPVPDVAMGGVSAQSLSVANVLAIVFGNAEHFQSHFLFGPYASWFLNITWVEVGCAALGNACLLVTLLSKRSGAVRGDMDEPSRGVRIAGGFSWQHLVVRLLIFLIIWLEIFGRMGVSPSVVYYHAFAGVTLLLLLPFVYLRHIAFVPVALYQALVKRRAGLFA